MDFSYKIIFIMINLYLLDSFFYYFFYENRLKFIYFLIDKIEIWVMQ